MNVPTTTTRLRRDWAIVFVIFALALIAGIGGIAAVTKVRMGVRWAIPTFGVVAFELWFLWQHLDANHPDEREAEQYSTLGISNTVTLARGGTFAAVAGFVAVEPTTAIVWIPALLYGAGCALDWVDGLTARFEGRTTVLGAKLDMAFDTLGFLVAPLVGVLWGRLPVWYLSLSVARYLFKAGRGVRFYQGKPVYDLPPSAVRRPLAGLQMAFITVALAPVLSVETVRILAIVVLIPSLAVFGRDYLVVAGRLERDTEVSAKQSEES